MLKSQSKEGKAKESIEQTSNLNYEAVAAFQMFFQQSLIKFLNSSYMQSLSDQYDLGGLDASGTQP